MDYQQLIKPTEEVDFKKKLYLTNLSENDWDHEPDAEEGETKNADHESELANK